MQIGNYFKNFRNIAILGIGGVLLTAALSCGGSDSAPTPQIKRDYMPERCVEVRNGGITYGDTVSLGDSHVEYLFCKNPEGGYSRFDRRWSGPGKKFGDWRETIFERR